MGAGAGAGGGDIRTKNGDHHAASAGGASAPALNISEETDEDGEAGAEAVAAGLVHDNSAQRLRQQIASARNEAAEKAVPASTRAASPGAQQSDYTVDNATTGNDASSGNPITTTEPSAAGKRAGQELLLEQTISRTAQQSKLRVVLPGVSQCLIEAPYDDDQEGLLHKVFDKCKQARGGVLFGLPDSYVWRMHVKQLEIRAGAYLTIAESTSDPKPFYNFDVHARGGKLRAVPKEKTVEFLTMRALPLSALLDFDARYPGSDSRQKQDQLLSPFRIEGSGEVDADDGTTLNGRLARLRDGKSEWEQWGREINPEAMYEVFYLSLPRPDAGWGARRCTRLLGKFLRKNPQHCQPGLSYVESAAAAYAGAPDIMISYSWQLDWRYMVAFLQATFDSHVMVWLDILACAQLSIEEGDLSEIEQLPEVVNFAGKTVVMPGVLNRCWCICEYRRTHTFHLSETLLFCDV